MQEIQGVYCGECGHILVAMMPWIPGYYDSTMISRYYCLNCGKCPSVINYVY
jgi:hypothetical protein